MISSHWNRQKEILPTAKRKVARRAGRSGGLIIYDSGLGQCESHCYARVLTFMLLSKRIKAAIHAPNPDAGAISLLERQDILSCTSTARSLG